MKTDTMKRKTFVFYASWYKVLSRFSADIQFAVYNAVMRYALYGEEVSDSEDDMVRMAFEFIREDIDMAQAEYDAKRQSRSRATQKRWAKAKEDNPEESQPQTSKESTTSTTIMPAEGEMPAEESSDDEAESPSSEIVVTYGRQPFEPLTSHYVDAGSTSRTSEREIRGNPGWNSDAIKIDYGDYGTRFAV